MTSPFAGVMPAVTTPFATDLSVDHDALTRQVRLLLDNGCTGIVPCGSLGEGATLSLEESHRDVCCRRCWCPRGAGYRRFEHR
jgi:1-pyrroline-4-hydroxy-2-carboxylate deaminase